MGIFQQFPYSNFHEMNLDQIIKIMREMQDEWADTKAEWASYKDFIDNYFANLNLDEEVLKALQVLANNGTLKTIIDPTIATTTTEWLNEHITPTTPAIDDTLSISGAGADAKVTGDFIRAVSQMGMLPDKIREANLFEGTQFEYNNQDNVNLMYLYKKEYSGIRMTGTLRAGIHYISDALIALEAGVEYTMFVQYEGETLANKEIVISRNRDANTGGNIHTARKNTPYHFVAQNTVSNCYCSIYDNDNNSVPVDGVVYIYILRGHYTLYDFFEPFKFMPNITDMINISYPTQIPYDIDSLYDYETIREIPKACSFIVDDTTHYFSDLPYSDITRAAVIRQPYQGQSNGYYVDFLTSWNPQYRGRVFIRISSPDSENVYGWYEFNSEPVGGTHKYVAFGDSLTRGYTGVVGAVADNPYPQTVGKMLRINAINEGVDGTGWFVDANNTGTNGYDKIMNYDLTDVDVISIGFGINDYLQGTQSLNTIKTRVETCIEHICNTYPLTTIILITPIYCSRRGTAANDFAFNANGNAGYTLGQYTDMLIEVGEKYHIGVIDNRETSFINSLNYNVLLTDDLHPTNDAYNKYSGKIAGNFSQFFI